MPLDRVRDLASTHAVTIEMAAAARPAFSHLRVGNPQVRSTRQCAGSSEATMNPKVESSREERCCPVHEGGHDRCELADQLALPGGAL